MQFNSDILIIGSGIAGLSLAINLVEASDHHNINIITKDKISESNTKYAQGGLSAVLSDIEAYKYAQQLIAKIKNSPANLRKRLMGLLIRRLEDGELILRFG